MTRRTLLVLASGAAMLAAVFWAIAASKPLTWVEPPAYDYSVRFRCGMEFPPGQYTVTVAGGAVSGVVADDAFSQEVMRVRKLRPENLPTLGDLDEIYRKARDHGADVATISRDHADGHPTRIRVDYRDEFLDDEYCFDIVRYRA
ncbi:DUF6174 domain-containing protein [Actinoplanes sp. NPDC049681]|uniref:DUF6174 domain-containing protein n=1 Tax=Actinoplanes sp. NPDC049681 TaxID=3363905 RepID=UPI0037A8F78C